MLRADGTHFRNGFERDIERGSIPIFPAVEPACVYDESDPRRVRGIVNEKCRAVTPLSSPALTKLEELHRYCSPPEIPLVGDPVTL